jgi:hypothetical protein
MCLNGTEGFTALNRIDIPNTPVQYSPRTIDPKAWTGSWKTITAPEEIAQYVCQANANQYHQAQETPFGQEPLLSHFGHNANTKGAESFIKGIPLPGDTVAD